MATAALALAALPAMALASTPPVIESAWTSGITQTDATLNATIDSQGLYTAYQFQIDTNDTYAFTRRTCPLYVPGYAQCQAIILGAPLAPGLVEPPPSAIPAGSEPESVSVDMAGLGASLEPDTTYHFRVIASNAGQLVGGPDRTFTTLSPLGAPTSPAITHATESHSVWRDGNKPAQIGDRVTKPPVGTSFSFTLNEPAQVAFSFTQDLPGWRSGHRCLPNEKRNASHRRCMRTVTAGMVSFTGHGGTNEVAFWGQLSRSRSLVPGRYTLAISASNSRGTSAPRSLTFTIAK